MSIIFFVTIYLLVAALLFLIASYGQEDAKKLGAEGEFDFGIGTNAIFSLLWPVSVFVGMVWDYIQRRRGK